jgi:hypothetical protein
MKRQPYVVGTLSYTSRDLGYGAEEDTLEGWWTGEVDMWGKHTFITRQGTPYYFFPDEVTEWLPGELIEDRRENE